MKNNRLDNFEQFIHDSIENHEFAYNPSDWDALSQRMGDASLKPFYKKGWFLGAASVAIIVTAYFSFLHTPENGSEKQYVPNTSNNEEINQNEEIINQNNVDSDIVISTQDDLIVDNSEEVDLIAKEFNDALLNEKQVNNTFSETIKQNDNETVGVTDQTTEEVTSDSDTNRFGSFTENVAREEITIPTPNANFYVNISEACAGTTVQFTAESQKNVDYLWKFDDGGYSKEMNPAHKYKEPGIYKVSLIVRSAVDNGILSKSLEQVITIHENPKVDFEWEMLDENGIPYTGFTNLTDKATKWEWKFSDGKISTEKDPNQSFNKKGRYSVYLTATNEFGCSKTAQKEVIVDKDYNLLAPNSFTPNGDGINDYFIPAALNRLNRPFTMTVYSATEGMIYETKNIDQPWDGINQRTGEQCREGSYVWAVKLINEKGETEQYKGAVLLLK